MITVGFLHTAHVHVETFTRLLEAADPTAVGRHVVDEALLDDARASGIDDTLRRRVRDRLQSLAPTVDVILCTCSTIGEVAESADVDVLVVRIDRPLARAAVRAGRRIAVVATVESTMAPTMALLREEAVAAGAEVELLPLPCLAAWWHFEAGDEDAYFDAIARHIDDVASDFDVVVLAQASMAPAADRCRAGGVVLTSPTLALAAVLAQSP